MQELLKILAVLDYRPLWISIETGIFATALAFLTGTFAAWRILSMPPKLRAFWDGILSLPLVLPPTVAGFFLLLLFSRRRPLGCFLYEQFDISVVQTFLGCVLAAFVIAFPLMYKNARAAFEQVEEELILAGRTLGMPERKIFFRVVLPTASGGLYAGAVLTFARAMGEYGATSMVAGNIPGRTATIAQRIALVLEDGDYVTAGVWVAVVLLISFCILFFVDFLRTRSQ